MLPYSQQPLTPKQALIITLSVLIGGIPAVFAANYFIDEPLGTVFLYYAGTVYLAFAVSWSYVDGNTRNAAIKGHNAFVAFVICLVIALVIIQKEHELFPRWAIGLIIAAGVAGYSVAGFCAVKNVLRWRRGEFSRENSQIKLA